MLRVNLPVSSMLCLFMYKKCIRDVFTTIEATKLDASRTFYSPFTIPFGPINPPPRGKELREILPYLPSQNIVQCCQRLSSLSLSTST